MHMCFKFLFKRIGSTHVSKLIVLRGQECNLFDTLVDKMMNMCFSHCLEHEFVQPTNRIGHRIYPSGGHLNLIMQLN